MIKNLQFNIKLMCAYLTGKMDNVTIAKEAHNLSNKTKNSMAQAKQIQSIKMHSQESKTSFIKLNESKPKDQNDVKKLTKRNKPFHIS